jgi:hypothetical protein
MTRRAIGRLAVFALTGAFVFAAVPAFACSDDNCADSSGPVISKHHKTIRVAHRRHHDDDDVASWGRPGSGSDTAKSQAKVEAKPNALTSDVADARAQMNADDVKAKPVAEAPSQPTTTDMTAASAQDPTVQVVNADELNDLDKAATDVAEPLPKLPASVADSRAEMHLETSSTWAQTSTIGKAFIAFGVMLTLASAARMFMA